MKIQDLSITAFLNPPPSRTFKLEVISEETDIILITASIHETSHSLPQSLSWAGEALPPPTHTHTLTHTLQPWEALSHTCGPGSMSLRPRRLMQKTTGTTALPVVRGTTLKWISSCAINSWTGICHSWSTPCWWQLCESEVLVVNVKWMLL